MTDFDHFPDETLRFLSDLRDNNTRDWFTAHKHTYEIAFKTPAAQFSDAMGLALDSLTGQSHSAKVFRIHRDVRFSKDKTPYNTHIHIAFAPAGAGPNTPMWFFGLNPDGLALGCGVFAFGKNDLSAFRDLMAGSLGGDFMSLTKSLTGQGFRVSEPELKRVPSGFEKDHPHGAALRRKGFAVWDDVGDPAFVTQPDLVHRTQQRFEQLLPVHRMLTEIDGHLTA